MDSKSSDKRPINRTNLRKPKSVILIDEITREVQERTGFRHQDIKEVFLCCIDVLVEKLCEKRKFSLPKIGLIYPTIKRGRFNMAMFGGLKKPEKIWMPSRWVLRLQPGGEIVKKLLDVPVLPDEEEEMFYGKGSV